MSDIDRAPSFRSELWGITRIMIAVIGGGLLLTAAVLWLADAEHHPLRAVVVLYSIILAVTIGGVAWWGYRQKRREWEKRQAFKAEMEAIRRGGRS